MLVLKQLLTFFEARCSIGPTWALPFFRFVLADNFWLFSVSVWHPQKVTQIKQQNFALKNIW